MNSIYEEDLYSITNKSQLIEEIHESSIISFDIFDTLLLRNVIAPTDVFKAVEHEYEQKYSKSISFYHNRIKAEALARDRSTSEDISFDEIYQCLEGIIGNESRRCKEIELDLENRFLIANEDMLKIFNYAKALNKTIYIVSDMYLSSAMIEKILIDKKIQGYNRLYVSNEVNKSKATGSIYSYIRAKENIGDAEQWLHIGDNWISDIVNAEKNGLTAFYYKRLAERENEKSIENLWDSIVRGVQINQKYMSQKRSYSYWYRFGANTASSVYIGLMNWLEHQLAQEEHIYFLSRDGYFPYRLYQLLREQNSSLPEASYLYASRRAYVYPYLLELEKEEAIDYLLLYNEGLGQQVTIGEVLENVRISYSEVSQELTKNSFSDLDEVVSQHNIERIKVFLSSIWPIIYSKLNEEREAINQYFSKMGLLEKSHINVFDIGWSGSTQLALNKLLKKQIRGYYFGTIENVKADIRNDVNGFAFQLGAPLEIRNHVIRNVMMYEFLFSAPEKSLIHFSFNEAKEVQLNFKNVEKNEKVYEALREMQQGAEDVFQKLFLYRSFIQQSSVTASLEQVKQMINQYRIEDMDNFAELSNSVGFGNSKDIKRYVRRTTIDEYIENHRNIQHEANTLLWKNAILIKDDQGRSFNMSEVGKLYGIKKNNYLIKIKRIKQLAVKAIKNPKKAIKKAINLVIAFMKR